MSADLDRGDEVAPAASEVTPEPGAGGGPANKAPGATRPTEQAEPDQPALAMTAADVAALEEAAQDASSLKVSALDLSVLELSDTDPLAPGFPVPRWLGALMLLVAALTLAWIAELWVTLPYRDVSAHYRLAWVGFDAMLAVVLARTGWLAWRGRDHVELPAVSAATLLVVDMWFDIVTSSAPKDRVIAVASAILVEIPLTALCIWIAHNAERVRRQRLSWALLVDPRSLRR
jgi:hypothetical protein